MVMERVMKKIFDRIQLSEKHFITYDEFIELALYDPSEGYYMKNREKVGKRGDFYTTPLLSSVFAEMIAKYFLQSIDVFSIEPNFYELGSGTGHFASSFLSSISNQMVNYYSIEKSDFHRNIQKGRLKDDPVQYLTTIDELECFNGFIFSNEFFDAFPVHVIQKQEGEIFEVVVTEKNGQLQEMLLPLMNERVENYLNNFQISLQNGQRLEIPLKAIEFYEKLLKKCKNTILMTIDYGYRFHELTHPIRKDGSLRGYYRHEMIRDVLKYPGQMDITHHIHFDAFIQIGKKYGFTTVEFARQDEFLLKIGILNELINHHETDPFSFTSKRNRAIRSLITPGSISNSFHVLIQKSKTC